MQLSGGSAPLPPADHVVRMLVLSIGPNDTFEQWTCAGWQGGPV
jgi:hypothetical protein